MDKAGYTATSCGRVGRGGYARFPTFRPVLTDQQTDVQTNGWTKPHRAVCPQLKNKAGYTAIQSRTVGQEQYCKNCLEFKNEMDQRT